MLPENTKLLFFFVIVLYAPVTCTSVLDTISANQTIRYGQTIVSPQETFELGFFKAGNSMNYYIGVWYEKIATGTVVWHYDDPYLESVSSRPVRNSSSHCCFLHTKTSSARASHGCRRVVEFGCRAEPIDPRKMKKPWARGALLLFGEVITATEREEITRRGRLTVRSSIKAYKLERSTVDCFLPPVSVFLREYLVDDRNRREKGGSDAHS
ncbi:hypothetical protein L2E82_12526 [Cichorium intybus]|uniref:Uncharacterized protein n=1 Tax=Cichorium intybus TaxID=13427 RepID=A0ACB9GHE3_CICIN|nr:hypothetical protein L2E82_12526 [Cichorium intybus]